MTIERSDKQTEEDANRFSVLCGLEWVEEIAFREMKELYERKKHSQKLLVTQ